ncbi:MAG: hypothetical protein R2794_13585 [Chitinophagales bacterium]
MLRLFGSSSPLTLLLIIIYAGALGLPWLLHPVEVSSTWPGFFGGVLSDRTHVQWQCSGLLCALVTLVVLCVQGIFISLLAQRYKILAEAGMIPAVLYITIYVLFAENGIPTLELFLNFILIWLLFRLFGIYNRQKADSIYFDAGLMNGLLAFMYFPAILFSVFSFYALFRLKPTTFREIVIWLSGILCVFFLGGTLLFWFHRTDLFLQTHVRFRNADTSWDTFFDNRTLVASVITGLLFLSALGFLAMRFSTNLIQVRRYLGASLMFVLFSVAVILVHPEPMAKTVAFAAIGMSMLIGHFLSGLRRRLYADITFAAFMLSAFILQYVIFAS